MIDPATGWFEVKHIQNKEPGTAINADEQAWLTRYPWPSRIVFDSRMEFLQEFADRIIDDYDFEKNGTVVKIHKQMLFLKEYIKPWGTS